MKKFEYTWITLSKRSSDELISNLNEYGNKGWELVTVEHNYDQNAKFEWIMFFKREI